NEMTEPVTPPSPSTPPIPPPPASALEGQRVAAALDRWKRKLLDLSPRNRALNFRAYKVSTIAIVDEQPAAVFRQLYLLEKSMRFKPAAETTRSAPTREGA